MRNAPTKAELLAWLGDISAFLGCTKRGFSVIDERNVAALRALLTPPTDDERRDLEQFVRELDADLFVQCPEGPNESAQLKAERVRTRKNFDMLFALIAAPSTLKAKADALAEAAESILNGDPTYMRLRDALAAYRAEGKEE